MTKLSNNLQALRAILPLCGLKEDAYGNFQKEAQGKTLSGEVVNAKLRVKIQDVSVRVELKRDTPGSQWNKIDGAYIKDVKITQNGVQIGRRVFLVGDNN